MDVRPVGVFDSGLGGLTALKRFAQLLPEENLVYLGDTGRVPYGSRSAETINKYAAEDTRFLLSQGVKAIIIACNTVSAAALGTVRSLAGSVPVFDVVAPPSERAANFTVRKKIGVLGTSATVRSGAYAREIYRLNPEIEVLQIACPLFVPLAENGRTGENDAAALAIAADYLEPLRSFGADAVILGCTHYPLLGGVISKILGGGAALIDSGAAAAESAAEGLRRLGMLAETGTPGEHRYFVTDIPDGFRDEASRFLGADIMSEIHQINIDS